MGAPVQRCQSDGIRHIPPSAQTIKSQVNVTQAKPIEIFMVLEQSRAVDLKKR